MKARPLRLILLFSLTSKLLFGQSAAKSALPADMSAAVTSAVLVGDAEKIARIVADNPSLASQIRQSAVAANPSLTKKFERMAAQITSAPSPSDTTAVDLSATENRSAAIILSRSTDAERSLSDGAIDTRDHMARHGNLGQSKLKRTTTPKTPKIEITPVGASGGD